MEVNHKTKANNRYSSDGFLLPTKTEKDIKVERQMGCVDVDTSNNAVLVLFPASEQAEWEDGRKVTISDVGGNASGNNITLDFDNTSTLEGSNNYIIDKDWESIEIKKCGKIWTITNQKGGGVVELLFRDTRANILALRSSNSLIEGAVYVATDITHIVKGGTAEFASIATATGQLADNGTYTSPLLNPDDGWRGVINWQNGQVMEVYDSVYKNHIIGATTTAAFEFGNSRVYENIVKDSTFNYDGGVMYRTTIDERSTVTVSATGRIEDSKILNGTVLNTNIRVRKSTFTNGANILLTTATGEVFESNFDSVDGSGLTASLFYSYRSTFSGNCDLEILTAGRLNINDCNVTSEARIRVSGATSILDLNKCEIGSAAYFNITAGRLTMSNSNAKSNCQITHTSSGRNYVYYTDVSSLARLLFQDTADTNRVYYSNLQSGSYTRLYGTTSASYIYYTSVLSNANIRINNCVNQRFYFCSASSRGYILLQNNVGTNYIYYCNATANGKLYALNWLANARMYNCNSTSNSRFYINQHEGNLYDCNVGAYYYMQGKVNAGQTVRGLYGFGRQTKNVPTVTTTGTPISNW